MLMTPPPRAPDPVLPSFVRARGGVRVVVGATPRGSAPLTIAESGGYRVRFPRGAICEGVLINTGGGMAGGDRMSVEAAVETGAALTLTTQAAEKVYRSQGEDAETAVALSLAAGSRLDWLPQEQILFSGARMQRTLDVVMAADAILVAVESVVFGRVARGEILDTGAFRDRWRIRRGGRLIFAEDVRLEGAIDRTLRRGAVARGARAIATVLVIAPAAEARLNEVRAALEGAASECGVGAWNGTMIARFLSPDPQALRVDLARFMEVVCGRALPRSWQT